MCGEINNNLNLIKIKNQSKYFWFDNLIVLNVAYLYLTALTHITLLLELKVKK